MTLTTKVLYILQKSQLHSKSQEIKAEYSSELFPSFTFFQKLLFLSTVLYLFFFRLFDIILLIIQFYYLLRWHQQPKPSFLDYRICNNHSLNSFLWDLHNHRVGFSCGWRWVKHTKRFGITLIVSQESLGGRWSILLKL